MCQRGSQEMQRTAARGLAIEPSGPGIPSLQNQGLLCHPPALKMCSLWYEEQRNSKKAGYVGEDSPLLPGVSNETCVSALVPGNHPGAKSKRGAALKKSLKSSNQTDQLN